MDLPSFGGICVVICDFMLILVTMSTLFLSIWHSFNENIGTDEDIFICIFSLVVFLFYNYFVENILNISWNRELEWKVIFIIVISFIVILFILARNDNYKSKGKRKRGKKE